LAEYNKGCFVRINYLQWFNLALSSFCSFLDKKAGIALDFVIVLTLRGSNKGPLGYI